MIVFVQVYVIFVQIPSLISTIFCLVFTESPDSSLLSIGSVVTADVKEDSGTLDANDSLPVFTEAEQNAVSPFPMSEHVLRCQTLNNTTDCRKSRRTFVKHAPVDHPHHSPQNAISFVNIDLFEPDSSEGEESVGLYDEFVNREIGKPRKTVNCMRPDFQKERYSEVSDLSSLNPKCPKDSLSQVTAASLAKYANLDMCTTPWSLSASCVSEGDTTGVNGLNLYDMQQKQDGPELPKSSIAYCNEMDPGSNKSDLINEPVVRPKIRKPVPASSSKNDQLMSEETGKEGKSLRRAIHETPVKVEKSRKDGKTHSIKESNTTNSEGAWKKGGNKDCVTLQEEKPLVSDTFWDDFEVYGLKLPDCPKDDDRYVQL